MILHSGKRMVILLSLIFRLFCASFAMSMVATTALKGTCPCGAVQIQVDGVSTETPVVDCHCPQCRKYHVSAFASYLITIEDESVTIIGEDALTSFSDVCAEVGNVSRLFCKQCFGKLATRVLSEDNRLMLCMGSLDDSSISESQNKAWRNNRIDWQRTTAEAAWPSAVPKRTRHGLPERHALSVKGSCACGDCAYTFTIDEPFELQHCYCKLCRQLSGSAFMTWVPVLADDLKWTNGEPPLVRTTNHGQRQICRNCGGTLTIVYDEDTDVIWPAAGGFNDDTLPNDREQFGAYLDRVVHICCVWKQGWYTLPEDGLERIDYAS